MKYKLYAFWKHDIPPYVLGGEVTEIKSNGRVCVKGFTGYSFLPLQILPLEEGRAKQKEIDLALKNYKNTIKKAEDELRSHTKQLSLKYTLTEIGHEHVSDFLKECSENSIEMINTKGRLDFLIDGKLFGFYQIVEFDANADENDKNSDSCWYEERWYDSDLKNALLYHEVPVTENTMRLMREKCKHIFDDKSVRTKKSLNYIRISKKQRRKII